VLLSWLRIRSGSLAAPVLLHLAANCTGPLAAYAIAHLAGNGGQAPSAAVGQPERPATG
jgi:membrane protease YdiL (CAAX protease family)